MNSRRSAITRLVNVAADDELGTGSDERAQDVVATTERALARNAPGRRREVVVQRDDAQRIGRALLQPLHAAREPVVVDRPSLLAPRPDRVEPDDDDVVGDVERLGRPERALPFVERACEPGREGIRDVVISRNDEEGQLEPAQEVRGDFELGPPPAVREIARCDEQLGVEIRDESTQRLEWLPRIRMAHVQVGEVEKPRGHLRGRLYTRAVAEESPELFDDIYLGLRAGGAARKQRRGEPLSNEDEEAISRWRRLSLWRKTIAVGAFALGTFGLGFTWAASCSVAGGRPRFPAELGESASRIPSSRTSLKASAVAAACGLRLTGIHSGVSGSM